MGSALAVGSAGSTVAWKTTESEGKSEMHWAMPVVRAYSAACWPRHTHTSTMVAWEVELSTGRRASACRRAAKGAPPDPPATSSSGCPLWKASKSNPSPYHPLTCSAMGRGGAEQPSQASEKQPASSSSR
eukprot:2608843-Prymnesium_polylepis.1